MNGNRMLEMLPQVHLRGKKIGGSYQADGTVVSIFKTLGGKTRVVFEFDNPAGMLHIFSTNQIELECESDGASFLVGATHVFS